MVILERPYISDEMKKYLMETNTPVLKNETALEASKNYPLNLIESNKFKSMLKKDTRLYTTSENALEWIYKNSENEALIKSINLMKNKVEFRKLLNSIYPDFFYLEAKVDELKEIKPESIKMPFILKPSVGFFSVGVYIINNLKDWKSALEDIYAQKENWSKDFPETVVGNATFILEEYISGEEYAIDAYFDENGAPVILNIMRHEFSDQEDVSDRLYYTSKEIIENNLERMNGFLTEMNKILRAKNFPVHVEVRVDNNQMIPIEFNPMRFAGWCTTDLVDLAFGIKTYEYYLKNKKPDWDNLLSGKENQLYTLIVLNKPKESEGIKGFDYDKLRSFFKTVLSIRKLDYTEFPIFGFLFTKTALDNRQELDYIIKSDLTEFTY